MFRHSDPFEHLKGNLLEIPELAPVMNSSTTTQRTLPFVLVGDEAFPLKPYLMRPFPGRGSHILPHKEQIYNYRLSRARRLIENSFGILVARWRIFNRPIEANIDNCEKYIKAAFVLHNYLRSNDTREETRSKYMPHNFVDRDDLNGIVTPGSWRGTVANNCVSNVGRLSSNNAPRTAMEIRDSFADYFVSPTGTLSWQNNVINS